MNTTTTTTGTVYARDELTLELLQRLVGRQVEVHTSGSKPFAGTLTEADQVAWGHGMRPFGAEPGDPWLRFRVAGRTKRQGERGFSASIVQALVV